MKAKTIMKTVLAVSAALFCSMSLKAADQPIVPSEEYETITVPNITRFNMITVDKNIKVIYTQNKTNSQHLVKLYAPKNVIEHVNVKIYNDYTLLAKLRPGVVLEGNPEITVICTGPSLLNVDIRDGGGLEFEGSVFANNIKINVFGNGEMKCDSLICDIARLTLDGDGKITVQNISSSKGLTIISEGNGTIAMKGVAQSVDMLQKGNGGIYTQLMQAADVKAKIQGKGIIKCNANNSLAANVTEGASLSYSGNPKLSAKKCPEGSVTKMN